MSRLPVNPRDAAPPTRWRKARRLVRDGFKDLAYLPADGSIWNATLAACAFSARRRATADHPDLNLWAAMHGAPPSARFASLRRPGVLWHGTSAQRAEKIRQVGLFHLKGVWAALEPQIAHGFTRNRSAANVAGSAMVVLVVDQDGLDEGTDYSWDSDQIVRFHRSIPPEWVEYILLDDRIEFAGAAKADAPKPWGRAHFVKRAGRWSPKSRPPVRFDDEHEYDTLSEWLELSIRRILATFRSAAAVEIFSSLYMTLDPWDTLPHEEVFAAIDRLCGPPRTRHGGLRHFALKENA